jgi:hypothetical protein
MKGRNAKLDPNAKIVARKHIKLNGRSYQLGDDINDSTVSFRIKEKLFRVGIITTKEDYELSRNRYGRVVEEPAVEAAPQEVVEDEAPVEEIAEVEEDVVVESVEQEDATEEAAEDSAPAAPRRGRPRKVN